MMSQVQPKTTKEIEMACLEGLHGGVGSGGGGQGKVQAGPGYLPLLGPVGWSALGFLSLLAKAKLVNSNQKEWNFGKLHGGLI